MVPGPSSTKRKRPESDSERVILSSIRSKKDMGIWTRDIKLETKLPDNVVNKSLKSLLGKRLIKEVVNIQKRGKKHYMAAEIEACKEISGGDWYVNGVLDKGLIHVVEQLCLRCIRLHMVSTLDRVHKEVKKSRVVKFDISSQQVGEILNLMVLDNVIIEVKRLGDYDSIPVGTTCYRVPTGAARGPTKGALASIPCGACPRISLCTPDPDGVISPTTCVYYTKWLNIDF
ncbi:hypothetical protein ACS0TY_011932 [Phlomoides rotata]